MQEHKTAVKTEQTDAQRLAFMSDERDQLLALVQDALGVVTEAMNGNHQPNRMSYFAQHCREAIARNNIAGECGPNGGAIKKVA